MNGKVEADEHRLLSWLETGLLHEAGEPDVFAIGLQEIIDLSASNVVMDGMTVGEGERQTKISVSIFYWPPKTYPCHGPIQN